MPDQPLIISTGALTRTSLAEKTAVVTGAGRGIGLEAARALCWLGARVVVAEIDPQTGQAAAEMLAAEFGPQAALFVQTDVGNEAGVARMAQAAEQAFGKVDIVLNNATIFRMGAIKDLPVQDWDDCYKVNLRGPVLLARTFLPGMIQRGYGVFACVSSVGDAYMAGYETFKAAQVHLANTLSTELEGSGVSAFTIGPGIVRTPGATKGIAEVAGLMGKTSEEIFAMNAAHELSPEAAGAGFAAAIALAEKYRGQEISSIQVLIDAGLDFGGEKPPAAAPAVPLPRNSREQALKLCQEALKTLEEQNRGFQARSLFEKQWVLRDFRKNAGLPVEEWLTDLRSLQSALESGAAASRHLPLARLSGYYRHMAELAKGYERNPQKLQEALAYLEQASATLDALAGLTGA
jgi:NAD(P)-dependent dehydrogenase (short-subunit alcohol dehydrogenase family)